MILKQKEDIPKRDFCLGLCDYHMCENGQNQHFRITGSARIANPGKLGAGS